MNGLCQQCQVYYPMPEDFARGVPYACPQCQTVLVPYGDAPAPPTPAAGGAPAAPGTDDAAAAPPVDTRLAGPPGGAGTTTAAGGFEIPTAEDPDAPDDITLVGHIPDALRPGPVAPPAVDPEARVRVLWFHPHASPEVAAARAELAAEEPKTPAGAVSALPLSGRPGAPGAPGDDGVALDDPWLSGDETPRSLPSPKAPPPEEGKATTFVLRGAGEGVSREELPLDVPKRAPPSPAAAEPPPRRTQEPVPRFRQLTTAATPVRRRGAAVIWAVVGVLLLGGAGATWYLTGPGAGTWRRLAGAGAHPAAARAPGGATANPHAPGSGTPRPAAPGPTPPAPGATAARPETTPAPPRATPGPAAPRPPAHAAHPGAVPAKAAAGKVPEKRAPGTASEKPAAGKAPAHRAAAPAKAAKRPPVHAAAASTPAPRAHGPKAHAAAGTHLAKAPAAGHPPAPAAAAARARRPSAAAAPKAPAAADPAPTADALDHIRRGNLLFGQGKIDEAISAYRAALKLDPRSGLAHRGLGVAYAKLGRAAAAAREYQRYLDLDPTAPDAAQVRQIVKAYYDQAGKTP